MIDYGRLRALYFGEQTEVVETLIDRDRPERLQHGYAHAMMAGLLYRPQPSSILLVGLGGGALVRFVNHYLPDARLDVVEIDPAVVRVARDYFGTAEGPRTRIIVGDGADYVLRNPARYDLILIDAHLQSTALADASGHPLSLKTEPFFRALHQRLQPGGVVMFNSFPRDVDYIAQARAAFPSSALYHSANRGNVIIAAADAPFPPAEALRRRADEFDRRGFGFSYNELLDHAELQ